MQGKEMNNYFELGEFLRSETAAKNNIQNYPAKFEFIFNLLELRDTILNPLREDWGSALIVSSGFRCKQLNDLLKGASKTSVHQIGLAVDIIPANGKIDEFIEFCKEWFKDKDYDQVIIEKSGKTRWVHIGLRNNKGEQRHKLFTISSE